MKLSKRDGRFSTVNLVKLSENCTLRHFNLLEGITDLKNCSTWNGTFWCPLSLW